MSKRNTGVASPVLPTGTLLGKLADGTIVEYNVSEFDTGQTVLAVLQDYNGATTYNLNEQVLSSTGLHIRSLQGSNTGNAPPTVDQQDTVWWEVVIRTFTQHDDLVQNDKNEVVMVGSDTYIPNGNVTGGVAEGFGQGNYMNTNTYFAFFEAAVSYAPGKHIVHTDGLIYIKRGTITGAAAWAIGFGDNEWAVIGTSPIGQLAYVAHDSGNLSGSPSLFTGSAITYQSAGMGVSIASNVVTLPDIGVYKVRYSVYSQNESASGWLRGSSAFSVATNCTVIMAVMGISFTNEHSDTQVSSNGVTEYIVTTTAVNATIRPQIDRNISSISGKTANRSLFSIERIA